MAVLASAITGILLVLSALHVYWTLGGRRASAVGIPEVGGRPAFAPTPLATLAVALALGVAALIVATRAGLWTASPLPAQLASWATWVLAAVFIGRAVGDFRLVGFSKRVRGSAFARWDTRLYSPLCAALGLGMLWLAAR
jgi:Protein of unknown function (DUF3995)